MGRELQQSNKVIKGDPGTLATSSSQPQPFDRGISDNMASYNLLNQEEEGELISCAVYSYY